MSAIKYEDGYRHFGSYCVKEKYRYLGYGTKLADTCIANSTVIKKASAYATPELARKWEKMYALVSRWDVGIYDLNVTKALGILRTYSDCCEVKKIDKAMMKDVYKYDTDVFGYNRVKFLEKWMRPHMRRS